MSEPREYPWAVDDARPTTLIALCPGDRPPVMTEVVAAFTAQVGESVSIVDDDMSCVPAMLWSAVVAVPGIETELAIWAEPARQLDPQELDDPAAAACRWIVGLETVLDADEPLGHFAAIMRLLAGACMDIPAVLDVDCQRWYPRAALETTFSSDDEPPAAVLWIGHVVESGNDRHGNWIHTHGLHRCSLPELEMLEVPDSLVPTAVQLLDTIAGRMLEVMLPPPGEPFAIGPDLDVTFRPWQDVAPAVADGPGGMAARTDDPNDPDNPHTGVRAVVCGTEVLQRIAAGDGAYFLSSHETNRLAQRARAAWPALTAIGLPAAGATDAAPTVQVLVKAGFGADGAEDEREHLWFAVRRFEAERAEAELLHQPRRIALTVGDVVWIERAVVSDWTVVTPAGRFGPAQTEAMARAVKSLSASPEVAP